MYLLIQGLRGAAYKAYTAWETGFGAFDLGCALLLVVLQVSTIQRSAEKPRGNKIADSSALLDLENLRGSKLNGLFSSFLGESKDNQLAEPKIKVTIKPRAKDKPTDEFRLNVSYQMTLTKTEQQQLKRDIPESPLAADKPKHTLFDEDEV